MNNLGVLHALLEGRSIGAEELKSTLGWPNLQARRNYLKCLLVHKCLHGTAPSYLLSEFRQALFFHGSDTRSLDLLRPHFAKTAKYQGSFRINGARTDNIIPRNIRQVETFSEFKINLSVILSSNACGTCCNIYLTICLVFNVLMYLPCAVSGFHLI